jgi:hypothetical protein
VTTLAHGWLATLSDLARGRRFQPGQLLSLGAPSRRKICPA